MANDNNICKLGARVEAIIKEGFKCAYYVATIIENLKEDKCLVEYDNLKEGEDENSNNLKEVVHVSKLRPLPPVFKLDEIIQVRDIIDAYNNDGWRTGEVTQIVDGINYMVYFDTPPHNLCVDRKHLRIHLDWVDGEWVKPSKKNNEPGALDNMTTKCSRRPIKPPVGNYCATPAKKTYTAALIRPGNGPVTRELCVLSKAHVNGNRNQQARNQIIENNEPGASDNMSLKCSGRPIQLPLVGNNGRTPAKKTYTAALIRPVNGPVTRELCVLSEAHVKGNRNERARDQIIENVEGSKGFRRTSIRKRARPRKFVAEEHFDGHAEDITNNRQVEDLQSNKIVKKMAKEWLSERCKDTSKTVETATDQNQGVTSNIPLAENRANETDTSKTDDHIMDDELMIDLGDDKHQLTDKSATAIDEEGDGEKSSAVGTEDIVQNSPPQERIVDIASGGLGTPSAIIDCNSMDSEDVPFIKHSALWEHVESIDLYRNTRRKPHFSPLLECSEVLREGLAIAHIITFTTVVEETFKLQFSDSVSVIQKNLQAIADLEKHGFDVEPVRTRLTVLLTLKEKEEKLEEECNEIKSEITNKALEKEELDQAVTKINQKIEELAEELKEIESKKVIKDKEISTLNSKEEAICENVHNLEHEFKSIAGCLF